MKDFRSTRYTFEELSEKAKEKAIEKRQEKLYEWLDPSIITEDLEGSLADKLGEYIGNPGHEPAVEGLELVWSLSNCQGDGVAIYGRIYKEQAPKLNWQEGEAYVELTRNHYATHYSHYNTFDVGVYDEDGDNYDVVSSPDFGDTLAEQLRYFCRELATEGYDLIDGYTSKEQALENLQDEGEVFTEDGNYSPLFTAEW